MEILVKSKDTERYDTLIIDDENLGKLAEAIQQYLKSKRELRKPEIAGAKK
jgi:hypothetical protein